MSVRLAIDIGGTFTDATLIDEETGARRDREGADDAGRPVGGLHAGRRARARRRRRRRRRRSASSSTRRPSRRTRSSRARSRAAASSRPTASATCSRSRARCGRRSTTRSSRSRRRSSRATARSASRERLGPAGEVLLAARRRARCARRPRSCARESVESVAVCLLHSYVNPEHEQRVGAILAEELPGRAGLALGRGRARVPRVPARLDDRDQRRDPAGRRALPRADRGPARRRRHRGEAARDAVERRRLQLGGGARAAGVHGRVGPGRGRDRGGVPRRDARPSATSSRSTWAARPRRSA